MSDPEKVRFPTQAEAMDLIDPGRRPYTLVRDALVLPDGREKNGMIALAIRALNKAHNDPNVALSPPLTEPLADAIGRADSFIDEEGTPDQSRGFKFGVGAIILSAVF